MIHTAECIDIHEGRRGSVAFVYRCCGDSRTDSVLDIADVHTVDVEHWKAYHQDKVQKIHERKLAAIAQITALRGAQVGAVDGKGTSHSVDIVGVDDVMERMLADDIVWIRYSCCGAHEHLDRIDRLWHGTQPHVDMKPVSKTAEDILAEIATHRASAAIGHANATARQALLASKA